jgi:hypothetical protein
MGNKSHVYFMGIQYMKMVAEIILHFPYLTI